MTLWTWVLGAFDQVFDLIGLILFDQYVFDFIVLELAQVEMQFSGAETHFFF